MRFSATLNAELEAESLSVLGLNAELVGFVTISGDFGFRKTGTTIEASASGVDAYLGNENYRAGLTNGELALVLNNDGAYALEASGAVELSECLPVWTRSFGGVTLKDPAGDPLLEEEFEEFGVAELIARGFLKPDLKAAQKSRETKRSGLVCKGGIHGCCSSVG